MSSFAAGMLRRTLTLADAETEHRRATAQRWVSALARQPKDRILTPPAPPEGTSSALRQPVVVLDASLRARFASPAARGLGIVPSYPKSLADLDGFRGRVRNAADDFPGARLLAAALFTLPTHSQLHRHDLQRIDGWLSQL
jgi:dTDP-4-amino-4,6-dideoxygalactose transaminase